MLDKTNSSNIIYNTVNIRKKNDTNLILSINKNFLGST